MYTLDHFNEVMIYYKIRRKAKFKSKITHNLLQLSSHARSEPRTSACLFSKCLDGKKLGSATGITSVADPYEKLSTGGDGIHVLQFLYTLLPEYRNWVSVENLH